MEERRKFRRTHTKERTLLQGGETKHEGSLIDISSGGMRILSDTHIKIGSFLTGQFKIMPQTGNFYVRGEVIWSKPALKESPHQAYESGIKFTKVSGIPIH